MGRTAKPLAVGPEDRLQRESIARSEESNTSVARRFRWSRATLTFWRTRLRERGIAGLHNELKLGRPRSTSEEQIVELVNTALQGNPEGRTCWPARALAEATVLSKTSVQRYLSLYGVRPHRGRTFNLSNDPFFIEKVSGIIGFYLNPPDHALVLCVDEKRQVEALERAQPVLPTGPGYVEGVTHDCIHSGTTTLFTALDIANGTLLTPCEGRRQHREFLSFLRHIEVSPAKLEVHLICDSYASHKHTGVRAWLARRPRFHVHFTPTYSSWLSQVDRRFTRIINQVRRRASFDLGIALKHKIDECILHRNQHPSPFMWIASAESNFANLKRLYKVITGHHTMWFPRHSMRCASYERKHDRGLKGSCVWTMLKNANFAPPTREFAAVLLECMPIAVTAVWGRYGIDQYKLPSWTICLRGRLR
jgi:transposase